LLNQLTEESDFRSKQVSSQSGKDKLGKKVPIIASHNPQLRIPFVVSIKHIDFVMMTKDAWDTLSGIVLTKGSNSKAVDGAKKFVNKSSQKNVLPLQPGNMDSAIQELRNLAKQGGILVDGGKLDWAHEAGRIDERSLQDKEKMRESAQDGLEAGEGFGNQPIGENNSPKALGINTMERFQEIYYQKLAERDNATGKVAAKILNEGKDQKVIQAEVRGLMSMDQCLVNAICNAAKGRNANMQELIIIRETIGSVSEMMPASVGTVDKIRQGLNIENQGIIVQYPKEPEKDITLPGEKAVTISTEDGIHFTSEAPEKEVKADRQPPQKGEAPKKGKKLPTAKSPSKKAATKAPPTKKEPSKGATAKQAATQK
jgi:hypothetical protein